MHKKYIQCFITLSLIICFVNIANAQQDKQLVINTINQFFEGMRQGDSTKIRQVISPKLRLLTVVENEGKVMLPEVSVERFLTAIGSPQEAVWDERVDLYEVKIDDRLASVWTSYKFYMGSDFSHCGINTFQLYKTYDGWEIFAITDTRRTDNCP